MEIDSGSSCHASECRGAGRGPDEGALASSEGVHPTLVAEDTAASERARRVDSEDCDAVSLVHELSAEALDEGALADPGDAADPAAVTLAGRGEDHLEELLCEGLVLAARTLHQRDRPGELGAIAREDSVGEAPEPGLFLVAGLIHGESVALERRDRQLPRGSVSGGESSPEPSAASLAGARDTSEGTPAAQGT